MKKRKIIFTIFSVIVFVFSINEKAVAQRQPSVNLFLGELVSSSPDSIFKAKLDIFIGDSIEVHSIHIVVLDSSTAILDNQFILSGLPVVSSTNAWKNGYTIHVDVPDVNPFIRKRYFVEFLSNGGQLLLQIEKEF